jgi:hypothetical protein
MSVNRVNVMENVIKIDLSKYGNSSQKYFDLISKYENCKFTDSSQFGEFMISMNELVSDNSLENSDKLEICKQLITSVSSQYFIFGTQNG